MRSLLFMLSAPIMLAASLGMTTPTFDDVAITQTIETQLENDPGVLSTLVEITTDEGIVKLSGQVDNLRARQRAAQIAETVRGVRSVVNQIEVNPPYRADNMLQIDVQTALAIDPATDSWQIDSSVEDGHVELTGQVNSWAEKRLAGQVVSGLSGVKSVLNKLRVTYDQLRADVDIQADVKRLLHNEIYVDDALINVSVDQGKVTLSGTVGSAAEKSLARQKAWVMGVNEVNADDLKVESWARQERFRQDKYAPRSDLEIISAIGDALEMDPRVNTFDIGIQSDDGKVTLTGQADNLKARYAAAADARNTVGVTHVTNHIEVNPNKTDDDQTIKQRVSRALHRDPYLYDENIDVSASDGVVTLTGDVPGYFEKAQADDAASRVNGVTEVANELSVDNQMPLAYDPYVYDWYAYDWSWYGPAAVQAPPAGDAQIEDNIESELWWSPYVDHDQVNVSVENGVATLTGELDSISEVNAAVENAWEGGASRVENDLKLTDTSKPYSPNSDQSS